MAGFAGWFDNLKNNGSSRDNVDWEVYGIDFRNGMPWHERAEKMKSGGYDRGFAVPSREYGWEGSLDNELYGDLEEDEHYL